jgi:NAD(P)-dependent dehydrogenase (short-subunit alcohol dehydrogenase family)
MEKPVNLDPESLFSVRGKVALVTGGSSGIGRMIATAFAANGVKVYITARKPDRLEEAVREISSVGECLPLPADLSDMDEIARLAATLAEREPALNILVNNAGASWSHPMESFPESGWDRVMDLNVKAPFFLTQKLLPLLSAGGTDEDYARVINLSSIAATVVANNSASYGPSKAALEQLTRMMARAFGDHRVTVNGIAPGWFPSRMNGPLPAEVREAWRQNTPLKRLGTIEDMGGLAIFLCSRAGVYINGRTIVIDGGETL